MSVRLTRAGAGLATAGLALLGLGMGFANLELLLLSSLPLLLVAYPLATRGRGALLGARSLSTRTPRRAEHVDVAVRLELPPGPDVVEVYAPIPPAWALLQGSNLHAFAGRGARALGFRARAYGRGKHVLPPVRAQIVDPAGVLAWREALVGKEETVEVTPRSFASKPVRGRLRGALALPENEAQRLGMGTTEFRELRDYMWGDPPKSINWKATARRLSRRAGQAHDAGVPLVNEFEHENRRTIVVLLDGGPSLRVGTTLETGIDVGIEAALAAARFFLARGSRVGAATYAARSPHLAPPDAGTGQVFALERALSPAEPDPEESPLRALERFHRHLSGSQPLVVVVTRITPESAPSLVQLAQRLRLMLGTRERRLPMLVLDVDALQLVPREDPAVETAATLVAREDAEARQAVQAAGGRVVPWSLGERDFRSALLGRGRR